MSRRHRGCRLVLLVMSSLFWALPSAIANQPLAMDVMVLVHVGPEDAALPRIEFVTETAQAAMPRVATIVVAPSTYAELCAVLDRTPADSRRPMRTGTFDTHAIGCAEAPELARRIGPSGFLQLLAAARAAASAAAPIPDVVDRIESIVRRANGMN